MAAHMLTVVDSRFPSQMMNREAIANCLNSQAGLTIKQSIQLLHILKKVSVFCLVWEIFTRVVGIHGEIEFSVSVHRMNSRPNYS